MGVAVSLVQLVNALTNVDGHVCVSGGTCQCFNHCGWGLSLIQNVRALTNVDGSVCISG